MREATELRALSKNELIQEVRRLEHLLREQEHSDELLIESAVRNDLEPYVLLSWGKYRGTVTPDEARRHALKVLAASNVAESDAAVVHFLLTKLEVNEQLAGAMLADMRETRGAPADLSYREEPSGNPERTDDQGEAAAAERSEA